MLDLYTELSDRILRFDGVSLLQPNQVQEFLLCGLTPSDIRVTELSNEINEFNSNATETEQLSSELLEPIKFNFHWKIPAKYMSINIEQYVLGVFSERIETFAYNATQIDLAAARVAIELEQFSRRGLNDLLRAIIFILDKLKESEQVYGVGRGSSCASYILFLLGLHVVDPIKFEISLEEFFHD